MNEELLTEIWLMAVGYMEKNHIETAAEHYIGLISEYTDDTEVFRSMKGTESNLDVAINNYLDIEVEEDFELDDEDI